MQPRHFLALVLGIVLAGIVIGAVVYQAQLGFQDLAEPAREAPTQQPSVSLGEPANQDPPKSNPSPDLATDERGMSHATATLMTSRGPIRFKFYPVDAPETVARITELAHRRYYNGLTFHRVIPGFAIQTGSPQGTEAGGSGKRLKPEFNQRRHIEGTLGMARSSDPGSADSQFYITLTPQPHLDRSYTVFGQVIDGMDVARRIRAGDGVLWLAIE